FTVELEARCCLQDLLSHLYVLVPVLDDEKHYWVAEAEVEKLLKHGEGWLATPPERALIPRRYLKYQGRLMQQALAQLLTEDDPDPEQTEAGRATEETLSEERISLNEQRLGAVVAALKDSGARRVLDLGCGEG